MNKIYLLSATLLMAGCTSPYGIDVAGAGRLPVPAGHGLQVSGSSDAHLIEKVTAALVSHGFKLADPAAYLVQITSSDMPAKTGAYLPESAPDESGKRAWLAAPSRSRAVQTRRITITLTDIATGREVYRASGEERYRAGKADSRDALIDAVVRQITEQNAISRAAEPEEAAT